MVRGPEVSESRGSRGKGGRGGRQARRPLRFLSRTIEEPERLTHIRKGNRALDEAIYGRDELIPYDLPPRWLEINIYTFLMDRRDDTCLLIPDTRAAGLSQCGSICSVSPALTIMARSRMFSSSRTLPGQS
jgi:hypothetical protein